MQIVLSSFGGITERNAPKWVTFFLNSHPASFSLVLSQSDDGDGLPDHSTPNAETEQVGRPPSADSLEQSSHLASDSGEREAASAADVATSGDQ